LPSVTDKYRLGKNCVLTLDGQILSGVRDVSVQRRTTEIDATGYGHAAQSSVVVHRTYELVVSVFKPADAAKLRAAEVDGQVVTVTTTNGLREVSADFVVCDSSSDETLDDAVLATFTLKQWMHGK
jgi:hypothetical protein